MTHRYESHNLDGNGSRRRKVFDLPNVMQPVYGTHDRIVGETPDYWAAVTDVSCPSCDNGTIRWAEAGYVPGYRICDGCGRHFMAGGNGEKPTLILFSPRRG